MFIILKQIYYKIKLNPSQVSCKTYFFTKSAQNKFCQPALRLTRKFLRIMRKRQQPKLSLASPAPHAQTAVALIIVFRSSQLGISRHTQQQSILLKLDT
jgi:hypothetical protein